MPTKEWEYSDNAPTICRCPKCRNLHTLEMFWTGKGKPWKFCEACRDMIARGDYGQIIDVRRACCAMPCDW